eukprot:Nk52_evm1s1837 gene=Nk52_evmTU1s1837
MDEEPNSEVNFPNKATTGSIPDIIVEGGSREEAYDDSVNNNPRDTLSGEEGLAGYSASSNYNTSFEDVASDDSLNYNNLTLYSEDLKTKPPLSRLIPKLIWNDEPGSTATHQSDGSLDETTKNEMNAKLPHGNGSSSSEGASGVNRSTHRLGTFMGVYFPCLQSILGVIYFLRLFWVVGEAGILQGFWIVALSCMCTLITSVSLSAIATNGMVPAGGSYYMISRSLGPEFGGAVGVLFYLANTLGVAMYVLGAIEILIVYAAPGMSMFGEVSTTNGQNDALLNNMRMYGTLLLLFLSFIVFMGMKYITRSMFVFLAIVMVGLAGSYIGAWTSPRSSQPDICLVEGRLKSSLDYCSGLTRVESPHNNRTGIFEGIPGLGSGVFSENVDSSYLQKGEVKVGVMGNVTNGDVVAEQDTSFALLIGIFFPSVTGIMAGSNLSGDLKDPQRSIPIGTIGATSTTTAIYLSTVLFLGGSIDRALLRDKFGESIGGELVLGALAWPTQWVILLGALFSTIGAGLQSLTGASRLLQAISHDNIIPFLAPFKVTTRQEPVRALLLTTIIAELGVMAAKLDVVAPILTMFFLICYAFVNLATTTQALLHSPNWRPRFRYYHWSISLFGMLLCLSIMFLSTFIWALVAIFLAGCLYKYIEYKGAAKEWGDGMRGLSLQTARYSLLRVQDVDFQHTKNWRPQVLVLCKPSETTLPRCKCSNENTASPGNPSNAKGQPLSGVLGNFSNLKEVEIGGVQVVDRKAQGKTFRVEEVKEESEGSYNTTPPVNSSDISPVIKSARENKEDSSQLKADSSRDSKKKMDGDENMCPVCGGCKANDARTNPEVGDAHLLRFISQLKKGRGLVLAASCVKGSAGGGSEESAAALGKRKRVKEHLAEMLHTLRVKGFSDVLISEDVNTALQVMIQSAGLGGLRHNTVAVSWPQCWRDKGTQKTFLTLVQNCVGLGKAILVVKDENMFPHNDERRLGGTIDVWWVVHDAGMMLLLAFLLRQHRVWKGCALRIFTVAEMKDNSVKMKKDLQRLVYQLRIDAAEVEVVEMEGRDISAYTYERTLQMERRRERLTRSTGLSQEALFAKDPTEIARSAFAENRGRGRSESTTSTRSNDGTKRSNQRGGPQSENLRRMNTAVKLNEIIKKRSCNADLIMLNLPAPGADCFGKREGGSGNYMEFVDTLTEGLQRVVLVKGGGSEVVTVYSST